MTAERAWVWPKDCYQPPRGRQTSFWPVEMGILSPVRRKPWWRRRLRREARG